MKQETRLRSKALSLTPEILRVCNDYYIYYQIGRKLGNVPYKYYTDSSIRESNVNIVSKQRIDTRYREINFFPRDISLLTVDGNHKLGV